MSLKQLQQEAETAEREILQAVAEGAKSLRELFVVVPSSQPLVRYAFYRALNKGRLVLTPDRRLELPKERVG